MRDFLGSVAALWGGIPATLKTIVLAAIGTVIGAWLVSRSQAKRRVIDELKAVRSAIALCFAIANKALSLKRQHTRRMKLEHDVAVRNFRGHQPNRVVHIIMDMETLPPLKFPGDVLEKIVFEKCGVNEKVLNTLVALTGAIDDLKNSIDDRNKLISECRVQFPAMQEIERISLYVGAPLRGIVDGRFSQNIDALGKQTDDCIFFSKILAEELRTYGNRLRRRNLFRFKIGMQKFLPPDWSMTVQEDLVPNEADYANWLRGFVDRPPWWKRFWRGLRASSSRVFSL